MRFGRSLLIFVCLAFPLLAFAQSNNASLIGVVDDPLKAVITGVSVTAINTQTGVKTRTVTNSDGQYVIPDLDPGTYRVEVDKLGFKGIIETGLTLHVQDVLQINFHMAVGSMSETITVNSDSANLNTTDGTVSTVIDRQLIENMPLNGKDLTTLFELSPGTILNAGAGGKPTDGGGFSVDGQRPTANYLTIDGASGNSYMPITTGSNYTGATIATSASGGTNGLLPIDAIEEYRMDTSTYTAENGRTPGGQVQVRTRSGTNAFHGTLFENFRNQVLDDTDWFVKYNDLKQAQLRMNDFGGTLGGPIVKNKLFFFAAHDTLLLDQPNTITQQVVPDASIIQTAFPTFKTWLGAYPAGNGGSDPSNPGYDFFSESYPDIIRDHTTSLRVDAQLPRNIHTFFRANLAPSHTIATSLTNQQSSVNIYTYTGGITIPLNAHVINDLTINRTSIATRFEEFTASVGGNDPSALSDNLPSGVNGSKDLFEFVLESGKSDAITVGPEARNSAYQWNIVDALSWEKAKHLLKVGGDSLIRQSSVVGTTNAYTIDTANEKQPPYTSLQNGTVTYLLNAVRTAEPVISLRNTSIFLNDSWRIHPTLTLNLGLRWEYNPALSVGPLGTFVVQGDSLAPATIEAAISNRPLYHTRYDNLAPRFGFAWSVPNRDRFRTIIRGGVGTYFDTGQAATASQIAGGAYPYQSTYTTSTPQPYASINFPQLSTTPGKLPLGAVYLVDPNLRSPRTYEWSLTIEQTVAKSSAFSLSYVGNDGESLVGGLQYYNEANNGSYPINPALVSADGDLYIITNQSHSNYQALQAQLTSRLYSKLDALVSYTWGHAEDNGSTDFSSVGAAARNPLADSANDVRNIFAAAIHYAPSDGFGGRLMRSLMGGWGFDTIARLQSASPMTVTVSIPNPEAFLPNADVVPGQPTILHQKYSSSGQLIPGGRLLNFNAFEAPPEDASGNPLRQGNSPTNGYRLFGLTQWDLAASRSWTVHEGVNLKFRIDAFNVLNIPNFADVNSGWFPQGASTFGMAQNTYAGYFGASASSLGINGSQLSTFQNGGPREVQLSLHLQF